MTLLKYWTKAEGGEERVVLATPDARAAEDLCRSLNDYLGYVPGVGVWSQDVRGYFFTRDVEVVEGDLQAQFSRCLEALRGPARE